LKKRLGDLGLLAGQYCVYRTKANCLRICEQGPIAVVYPEGVSCLLPPPAPSGAGTGATAGWVLR
jgi:hypothetical protein